jgi:spermidine synthase
LYEVGFSSIYSLLGTYAGHETEMRPWLTGAEINRDGNLRLQYMAGMALNISLESVIYNDILKLRTFPRNLFDGAEERLQRVQAAMNDPMPQ